MSTTPSVPFREDAELAKIAESGFSGGNYEQLSEYIVRGMVARKLGGPLISASATTIGLTELRASMNLAPLPTWKHSNYTNHSDHNLASAPTIQAFYDLKEPRSGLRNLDNPFLQVFTSIK